jgi:hypothetical protein
LGDAQPNINWCKSLEGMTVGNDSRLKRIGGFVFTRSGLNSVVLQFSVVVSFSVSHLKAVLDLNGLMKDRFIGSRICYGVGSPQHVDDPSATSPSIDLPMRDDATTATRTRRARSRHHWATCNLPQDLCTGVVQFISETHHRNACRQCCDVSRNGPYVIPSE